MTHARPPRRPPLETTSLHPYARLPRTYARHTILTSSVDAYERAHWLLADDERDPVYDARVVTVTPDQEVHETHLSAVTARFPLLDVLPEGEFVVADARRRNGEDNAQVFGVDGRPSATFALGDAIEHLLADESGELWTGYFDEGVFGDDPLSIPGLRRWSATGEPVWELPSSTADGCMADCYALNVFRGTAWACYYTDFPLVCVGRDASVRVWTSPVTGAKAVVVHKDRVAYFGGYGEDAGRLVQGTLTRKTAEPHHESTLVRPDGLPLGRRRLLARGPRLYVQTDPYDTWHLWDLSRQ